jgi:hypothetical protein
MLLRHERPADMALATSRRLVIDASVAQAAGGKLATHPTAKRCRDFLQTVLKVCHRAFMSPDLGRQWKGHRSQFFMTWRVSMEARKKILHETPPPRSDLLARLVGVIPEGKNRQAVREDFLLLEAALASDLVVVALDDSVREVLSTASGRVREIGRILWVNPATEGDTALRWLKAGAPTDPVRQLDGRGR